MKEYSSEQKCISINRPFKFLKKNYISFRPFKKKSTFNRGLIIRVLGETDTENKSFGHGRIWEWDMYILKEFL